MPYSDRRRAACGRSLGDRADDYTTALSADDLAAVDRRGSGWAGSTSTATPTAPSSPQVFAGRHPEHGPQRRARQRLPDVRRDGVVPDPGAGDAPRLRPRSAERSPACRDGGRRVPADAADGARRGAGRALARQVRTTPTAARMRVTRRRRAPGHRRVRRDVHAGLLPRAHRRAPLRRCRATGRRCCGWSPRPPAAAPTPEPVYDYSEGLDAAVACHDYPQLYDMTAPPARARAAVRRGARRAHAPGPGPAPTGRSPSASTPTPTGRCSTGAPAGRSAPRGQPGRAARCRRAAATPPTCRCWCSAASSTSITTAGRGRPGRRAVPERPARRWSRNSFHVTAVGDTDDCAVHGSSATSFVAAALPLGRPARPVRRAGRAGAGPRPRSRASRGRAATAAPRSGAVGAGPRRGAHRRRPPGPVVEQLLRPRRRPPRRHLELHAATPSCGSGCDVRLLPACRSPACGLGPYAGPCGHRRPGTRYLAGSWDTRTVGADAVLPATADPGPAASRHWDTRSRARRARCLRGGRWSRRSRAGCGRTL